jgi:DNA-binding LytR/AlgR family response regulator
MSNLSRYRIGVLEDDPLIAETLTDILETLGHQVLFVAASGRDFLQAAKEHEAELYLLDIKVKGERDGVETAAALKLYSDVPYVFTTAYADESTLHRVKQTAPYGYVVKPYGLKEIQVAIQVAMVNKNRTATPTAPATADHLFVKADGLLQKVRFSDLYYVEAQGDYMVLYTGQGRHTVHITLKKLLERLPGTDFMQVHRGFIVQLAHIDALEENSLVVHNKHIPLSKSKVEELRERLNLL